MIHEMWRLSEGGDDNLSLAVTPDGLALGRTWLIERRDDRFVVRDQHDIARLLGKAYDKEIAIDRLMAGLARVAAALNAGDRCLAAIAAVHLKLRDLPGKLARDDLETADTLIKYGAWNPELHPRTGTPPNPGWFGPTGGDGGSSAVHVAQNDDPNSRPDAWPAPADDRVKLPAGDYIDELHDFLEWLANAKPEDEPAIRAEIKRYYYDVGDTFGGDTLNRIFSDVLEAGNNKKWRQQLLNDIASYAKTDPSEIGFIHGALPTAILSFPQALLEDIGIAAPASEETAEVAIGESPWLMGWARRGRFFDELLRDKSLPLNFPTIDNFTNGVATSIKSIDLNAPTYRNAARLASRLNKYIEDLSDFDGDTYADETVRSEEITARELSLVIPKGSMTEIQREVFNALKARLAGSNYFVRLKIKITEF